MSRDEVNQVTPQPVPETQLAEKTEATPTIVVATEETPADTPVQPVPEPPSEQPRETATNSSAANGTAPPTPPKDEPVAAKDQDEEPKPTATVTPEPDYLSKNPALSRFFSRLPSILHKAGYNEMWGVSLKDSSDPPTANVMIKFLRANEGNVNQAEEQLTKALEWRKKLNPLALAETSRFSTSKFGGLGYITTYNDTKSGQTIFNWNIYGAVKNVEKTFGNLDE
jgi:phosphatidylinositol transfer protein SFH5